MVGASPGVPPGLALGQGKVRKERCQRTLYLVRLPTQSMLSGAVVGALPIETDIIGCKGGKMHSQVVRTTEY